MPVLLGCHRRVFTIYYQLFALYKDAGSLVFADASWVALSVLSPDLWEVYRQTLEILQFGFQSMKIK